MPICAQYVRARLRSVRVVVDCLKLCVTNQKWRRMAKLKELLANNRGCNLLPRGCVTAASTSRADTHAQLVESHTTKPSIR